MNSGFSWYHSLQVRAEKRLSGGLLAQYSLTWSKFMQAIAYLNPTDPQPEKVISDLDRPLRHVPAWIYEMPFGQRKTLGNSANQVLSMMISGWNVPGIYTYQSGTVLLRGNALLLPGENMPD